MQNELKRYNLFQKTMPILKDYILSNPDHYRRLNQGELVNKYTGAITDLDHIFVLAGSLQLTLEPMTVVAPLEPNKLGNDDEARPDLSSSLESLADSPLQKVKNIKVLTVSAGEGLDPDKFSLTSPTLRKKDIKSMPFLYNELTQSKLTQTLTEDTTSF